MRIALVSHEYPPFRGGGIGTYTTVMADAFARAGHEIHVVTNRFDYGSTDPVHAKPVHRDGNLWVHRIEGITDSWQVRPPHDDEADILGQLHRHWSPYLYYAELVADRLEAICREHQIDVAEFPECAAEGFSVLRRRALRLGFESLPITVTLHSPIWEIYQYNLYSRHNPGFHVRSSMEDQCIRMADMINSPSALLAKIVQQRLGLADGSTSCDVIPLPMDFSSIPEGLPGPDDSADPTLLFIGRLEPRKGVRYLVDAAVRVMREYPRLRVILIGKDCDAGEAPGTMTDFLRARIPSHMRDNFEFLGSMPRDTLFARYASATACVFAAPWDNFPLTCMEAMACGACVIASDYTGMAEMIEHERSGLLFPTRDVGALAASITRVIETPSLARKIRSAAPGRIRAMCDPDKAVTNRISHYQRVIESRRTATRLIAPVDGLAPRERPLVSVMTSNTGRVESLERTVAAVIAAGDKARVTLDVAILAQPGEGVLREPPKGARLLTAETPEPDALRRRWLAHAASLDAHYLLHLRPGDVVSPSYLESCLAILDTDSSVAWVAAWSMPAEAPGGAPYAGFDSAMPLEIIIHRPPPFMVLRRASLERVGGYNHELPPGWAEWDLTLALHEAGLRGVVIPFWLARHAPREGEALPRPATHEVYTTMLEAAASRSPGVITRHAVDLWLYAKLQHAPGPTGPAATLIKMAEPIDDWWVMTKTYLKRRWPSGAKAYRRVVKGKAD